MRRIKPLIFLLPSVIAPLAITGCSCNKNKDNTLYVAIPKEYLQIENNILEGIKNPTQTLSKYNTLQVPTGITKVLGFIKEEDQVAYDCIKYIVFSDNKCTELGDRGIAVFQNLPNLEKITLPSSINSINTYAAFSQLPKLKTIDASALDSIECFKTTDVFIDIANNGTFYTKNQTQADELKEHFVNHTNLKTWTFKTK